MSNESPSPISFDEVNHPILHQVGSLTRAKDSPDLARASTLKDISSNSEDEMRSEVFELQEEILRIRQEAEVRNLALTIDNENLRAESVTLWADLEITKNQLLESQNARTSAEQALRESEQRCLDIWAYRNLLLEESDKYRNLAQLQIGELEAKCSELLTLNRSTESKVKSAESKVAELKSLETELRRNEEELTRCLEAANIRVIELQIRVQGQSDFINDRSAYLHSLEARYAALKSPIGLLRALLKRIGARFRS